MPTERHYTYEGLFLFPQAAVADMQSAVEHIKDILQRGQAKILSLRKWEERRLAYEIRGNKRGLYFLVYFTAPGNKMVQFERDCNLSERLLRSLITRADHLTAEQIAAADGQAQLADEIRLRKEQPAVVKTDVVESEKTDAESEDLEYVEEV